MRRPAVLPAGRVLSLWAVCAFAAVAALPRAVLAGVNCTNSAFGDYDCTIYLANLDRTEFLNAFYKFGIPMIICLFLGGWAFSAAQFKLRLLPSVVSMWSWPKTLSSDDKFFEKALWWLCAFIVLVAILPSVFILLWGIYVYANINHLLGFAIFLVLMAVQLGSYAFFHWKVNGWRLDRLVTVLFVVATLLMYTFEIWTIYLQQPYSYFMLSVVWVSVNFLPMMFLTYLVARGMTKPLQDYELLGADPVVDYLAYIAELKEAQKIKVGTQDKIALRSSGEGGAAGGGGGMSSGSVGSPSSVGASSGGTVRIHVQQDEEKKEQQQQQQGGVIDVKPNSAAVGDSTAKQPVNHGTGIRGFMSRGVDKTKAFGASVMSGGRGLINNAVTLKNNTYFWKKCAWYLVALAILVVYACSVALIKETGANSTDFANVVGWVTSGTIVCLDLCVWLCVYGGKIETPLEACIYQGACRVILVLFGDTYWFIGHSIMYVVLASFFGQSMVNHALPKLNGQRQKKSAVDDLMQGPTEVVVAEGGKKGTDEASSSLAMTNARYSNELGAGFVNHGWFSRTWVGRGLIKNIEIASFLILTAAFLADLIVVSSTSTVKLQLTVAHEQYLAGVLALFLMAVILSTCFLRRMYFNRDFRIDVRLLVGCFVQWLVCIGCGVFLWDRTRSVILICCFCFLPPVVYLGAYSYAEWIKLDFQLWEDPADANKPKAPGSGKAHDSTNGATPVSPAVPSPSGDVAITNEERKELDLDPATPVPVPAPMQHQASTGSFRGPKMAGLVEVSVDLGRYNSWKKYHIVFAVSVAALLVIAMGAVIAALSTPPYVGYTIMCVILILVSTIVPMIEWFNSFQVSNNMIVQGCATTVFFVAFILIFWIQELEMVNDNRSLGLLFVLFMYPTFVTLAFALIKWRDDKWRLSLFVKIALLICCAFITTFLIVVAVVYNPWQIGAALLVAFMVILFGSFLVPILTTKFPWLVKWFIIFGLCVLIAFAAGLGSQPGYGFAGFSLAWLILFLCLVVAAFQAHRERNKSAVISHMASPNLFPVFAYQTTPGIRNPLKPDDARVYLVYAALTVSMVWGLLAVFFVQKTWIGLGIHAVSIVLMILYALEATSRPRIMLARAVRYMGEGSPLYVEAVKKAKGAAFMAQLSSIKVTSKNPDQQQQASPSPVGDGSASSSSAASPKDGKGGAVGKDGRPLNFLQRTLSLAEEALRDTEFDELVLDGDDLKLLGLDEPNKKLTELDWKGLYDAFVELRNATPAPSALAFTKGDKVEVAMVKWRDTQLPRRRAHELLLKLDHHIALLYGNTLKYQTHLTIEVILAAEALKAETEAEMITMLRDTGHLSLTVEYLRALKPNSPEKIAIENALFAWKAKQEQIKLDRIRKRKEEEEAVRIREEEDRARLKEEEEKLIRQRQEQARADEQAAIIKQQELARREQQEQAEREEQVRREQLAAKIEAERIEREQQEKIRKQQEAELMAKLVAEQNDRALQELRSQQEAQRVAEERKREQERIKLQQIAAEQAARDLALAAQAVLQQKVATAVAKHVCTLNETGAQFVAQQWFQCVTCGQGCCVTCMNVCHKGHQLQDMGVSPQHCDCGKSGCEAATGVKPGMKGRPTLASIEAEFARSGKKWVDPDFPHSTASLLRDPNGKSHPDWKQLGWKRPEELRNFNAPTLFHDGADPLDINQGNIGDCWFMSAISVMTQRQKDFVNIFESKEHTKAGVYSVNFWKNGEKVNVLIDSMFPATRQGQAAFGHSAKDNELWVMILEKAYAKIHRNYESIEAGFVDQALVDLSGGIGSRIDMSKDPYKQQTRNGVLFKQLLQYRNSGFLLGAGSPAGSDSEANASPSGIVQGHAYSVLDVQEVDQHQLIRLRNPWGRKEWTGDWSDSSDLWTRRMKAKLNWVSADDGAFWMNMTDFATHFDEVYVCRFFDPSDGWVSLPKILGEWKGPTAGGCTNFDSVKDNPQFLLTVTQPNTTVVINLSQTETRGTSSKLKPIAIEVYGNKGQRVTRTRTGPLIASNPDSYIFRREISLDQQLQPSDQPYTVLISTFNQNEETKFAISIHSTAPVLFEVAPPAPEKKKK